MDAKLAYLQNQVNSATPTGLVVLLHEGLINFALTAKEAFENPQPNSPQIAAEAIDRCTRIVTELNNSLRHDQVPELSDRLSNLYTFFIAELSRALKEHSVKLIGEMIPLFENLRDSWKQAELMANQSTPMSATSQ